MGTSVPRRGKTRKWRQVDPTRRRQEQRRIQGEIDRGIARVVVGVIEQALQDAVTALLGRARGQRRNRRDGTRVAARCNRCRTHQRQRFYRAGSYARGLLTGEGWGRIRVPRVSCVCGGMVGLEFVPLAPYGRHWYDLAERARQLAGLCVSLRDSVQVLAWRNGQPLSIATVNRLVNETAPLAAAFRAGPLARVPAVVMLDGVWLKALAPTGEEYVDARGRRRQRRRRRKFPLLLAWGVDPVSGEGWLLDWEPGREEDEASWKRLLERLWARGLHAERGLELVVHDGAAGLEKALDLVSFGRGVARQRCIFHKLQNVGGDVAGEAGMTPEERRERRTAVLREAAAVYRGTDAAQIHERLAAFRAKWGEQEPKAVATLERDFERTVAYVPVWERARQRGQGYRVQCLRAISHLERVGRQFRQKFRQVGIFHADRGVEAGIQLVIGHRQLAKKSTEPWTRLLEEDLLAAAAANR